MLFIHIYVQYTYLHSPVVLVLCKGVMMVVVDPLLFQGEPLELNLGTLSLLHCLELVCCRHWPTQRRGLGHLTERTTCTQHASKCRNHITQRKIKCIATEHHYTSYQRAAVEAPRCQWGIVPEWEAQEQPLGTADGPGETLMPADPSGGVPLPRLPPKYVTKQKWEI